MHLERFLIIRQKYPHLCLLLCRAHHHMTIALS
jgi:hypothetical protein